VTVDAVRDDRDRRLVVSGPLGNGIRWNAHCSWDEARILLEP